MKKMMLVLLVLVSLFLLSGCKSKFEQQAEKIKNIKITVDQDAMEEMEHAKEKFRNGK